MKNKLLTIFCIFTNISIIVFLIVVYGNNNTFRNWWITNSISSGNHKWLAKVLYSDTTIKNTLAQNIVIEISENTDTNSINFDTETKEYSSIYEKQILEHESDEIYKLVKIKENGYSGYIVAIYDASRIHLVTSKYIEYGGQTMDNLSKDNEAIVAINASGFSRINGALLPTGTVIQNGEITSIGKKNTHGGGLIGFNKDNVLVLTTLSAEEAINDGMVDAMTFGPFLIVNGKKSEIKGNGGLGVANRTAIAQRKDGVVLFLVVDGRGADGSNGITINEMITLLDRYGAYNAANLDGGGSSSLAINGEIINNPRGYGYTGARYLPNAWILK